MTPAIPPLPATTPVGGRPIRRRSVLFGGLGAAAAAVAVPTAFVLWPKDAPPAEPKGKPKASKSPDRDVTRPVGELKGHERNIESLAVSRDGKFLATGSDDTTLKLWDLTARREKATFDKAGGRRSKRCRPPRRPLTGRPSRSRPPTRRGRCADV
ncbi:WD40 repeat domain-containing protein [Streptomyces sp. NPDC004980]